MAVAQLICALCNASKVVKSLSCLPGLPTCAVVHRNSCQPRLHWPTADKGRRGVSSRHKFHQAKTNMLRTAGSNVRQCSVSAQGETVEFLRAAGGEEGRRVLKLARRLEARDCGICGIP